MKLEKCGRCGVLYEQYNTRKNPKKCNGIRLLNIQGNQFTWENGRIFLCPECMAEFMSWLYAIKDREKGYLKKCPSCGGKSTLIHLDDYYGEEVILCVMCRAVIFPFEDEIDCTEKPPKEN